jgi:hypothetical protein
MDIHRRRAIRGLIARDSCPRARVFGDDAIVGIRERISIIRGGSFQRAFHVRVWLRAGFAMLIAFRPVAQFYREILWTLQPCGARLLVRDPLGTSNDLARFGETRHHLP